VVGICSGVPFGSERADIVLGDVVISDMIVQYDFGRRFADKFVRKNTFLDDLGRPNMEIRSFLAKLKGRYGRKNLQYKMCKYLDVLSRELGEEATYPGATQDKLFDPTYRHKHQTPSHCATCAACEQRSDPVCEIAINSSCDQLSCDQGKLILRSRLSKIQAETMSNDQYLHRPVIHFGLVASGDTMMRSGEDRDEIAVKEKAIAFEMEGAGVWDNFPCVIIKGVCDYADSHMSKRWQDYAAATAAACMKGFLDNWTSAGNPGCK